MLKHSHCYYFYVVKCTNPDLPEYAYVTDLTDSSQYSDQSVTIACDQGYRLSNVDYMNETFSFGGDTITFSCGYDDYNGNYDWIELSEWSCIGKYYWKVVDISSQCMCSQ